MGHLLFATMPRSISACVAALEELIGIAPVFLPHLGIFQHVHHAPGRVAMDNHRCAGPNTPLPHGMRHEHLRSPARARAPLQHSLAFLRAKAHRAQKSPVHGSKSAS